MEKVFEIYIKTTPERLWEAITESELRQQYNFGVGIESDWTPGSTYNAGHAVAGMPISEGENLEVDPPRRLVQTMTALWSALVCFFLLHFGFKKLYKQVYSCKGRG